MGCRTQARQSSHSQAASLLAALREIWSPEPFSRFDTASFTLTLVQTVERSVRGVLWGKSPDLEQGGQGAPGGSLCACLVLCLFLGLASALLPCPVFVENPARNAVVVPSTYLAET